MGCRTGFYLLTRNVENIVVFYELIDVLEKICAYDGDVFGASEEECGNFRELDLNSAKKICKDYLDVLKKYSSKGIKFDYPL